MCSPDGKPSMLLREEPCREDQSLTDVAFYPSESCLVKMLYRAGFATVNRVAELPEHDDFRETSDHARRRTLLAAFVTPTSLPGSTLLSEPREAEDPWTRRKAYVGTLPHRAWNFLFKPPRANYSALATRPRRSFPKMPITFGWPFGWWCRAESGLI